MPWLPEIELGRALFRATDQPARLGFFEGISLRDPDELLASFAARPLIDDPRHGRVEGEDAFRAYVVSMREWLAQQRGIEPVALMFANEGGIPLQLCTVTDDGTRCAIEYNAVRWGRDEIPPQAGIALYERGPSGRLAAARIYDDVTPPAVSDSTEGLDR
jgi:hypothetical protein